MAWSLKEKNIVFSTKESTCGKSKSQQMLDGGFKMNKFKVSWRSKNNVGSSVYEGHNQFDVLMKIMKVLSEDGIHAPQCVISVKPVKD